MTASVAKEVAFAGTVVLGTTLVVVGVATAMVLHQRQATALDEALLIAAHGRAHPDVEVEVEVEHSRAPIEAWIVDPDVDPNDGGIPRSLARAALRAEAPLYATLGDRRVVLLPFEVERRGADDREELAAAAAPAVTLARSVGPFAAVYAILATLAALFATFVQRRIVRRAFEPLDRARRQAGHVTGFGTDQRLAEEGPVEVRPLLVAINGLLTRLERSHRAQSRFTAEAAHELRTPVTGMLGELDVTLRSTRSAEEYRATLASMRDDVLRLRQLVDGLTTLSRLDAEDLSGTRELMRAGEIVAHALAAEAGTLRDAGSSVTVSLEDDPEIVGHNPGSSVAIWAMLGLTLGLGVSGALMSSNEAFEEVHEVLAYALLAVVIVHVAGVIWHTIRHRENITGSMIHGTKEGEAAEEISSIHPLAAVVFLALTAGWAGLLVAKYDAATRTVAMPSIGVRVQLGEAPESELAGPEQRPDRRGDGQEEREEHDDD